MKLKKVKSLGELETLASTDEQYERLAVVAASNLGGNCETLQQAMRHLRDNAMETDEKSVVGEVNFCRDLI